MKILIYWFWKYKKFRTNITEKILENIEETNYLKKIIYPVEFREETILNVINQLNPEIILWLWQHPRAKKIRIEKKAINLKRQSKEDELEQIVNSKTKNYFLNLKIKSDYNSTISYNSWKYVCNFSMYTIMHHFGRSKKIWFIHIPKNYNVKKATKFIKKILLKINT